MKMRIGFVLLSFVAAGCIHGETTKDLDRRIQNVPPVSDSEQLSQRARDSILANRSLTDKQRAQLLTLQEATQKDLAALRERSLRLREILILDVGAAKYDPDDVGLVKSKLMEVEEERVQTIFDAVDKANTIMGRNDPRAYRFLKDEDELPLKLPR